MIVTGKRERRCMRAQRVVGRRLVRRLVDGSSTASAGAAVACSPLYVMCVLIASSALALWRMSVDMPGANFAHVLSVAA